MLSLYCTLIQLTKHVISAVILLRYLETCLKKIDKILFLCIICTPYFDQILAEKGAHYTQVFMVLKIFFQWLQLCVCLPLSCFTYK